MWEVLGNVPDPPEGLLKGVGRRTVACYLERCTLSAIILLKHQITKGRVGMES